MPVVKAIAKPEEAWRPARLIPTTGIGGQEEQEQRATSSLLAVMQAVPQFGRAIAQHAGAPAGGLTSYTEIRFQDEDTKLSIPDGALVVERGKTRWVCLIEVKTSGVSLRADQITRYLDLARANNFEAVLTISNQITASPLESPVVVEKRHLKSVVLRHLSWWQIMTEALVQYRHKGISDPDQAWILGELIAYLDHEKAGAGGFDDMGDKWVQVRDGARQQTLRASDPAVRDVASKWEQLIQYIALGLCQDLGREVSPVWPRGLEPAERTDLLVRSLVASGRLDAFIKVPDAAAPLEITADLRARLLTTSAEVAAPRVGRPKTRIAWMVRQLNDAPDHLRLEVRYPNAKETVSASLKDSRDKPEKLLYAADLKRDPRSFKVSLSKETGAKRGRSPGSFVYESKQQTIDYYRTILQHLRAWSAAAPKLPEPSSDVAPEATPEPPAFGQPSSREFGEATQPDPD